MAFLREAARRVFETAKRENFALGLPVVVYKDKKIVEIYPDGTEKVLKKTGNLMKKVKKKIYSLE